MDAALESFDEELAKVARPPAGAVAGGPRLADLAFSDLYLRVDGDAPSRYRALPGEGGHSGNLPLPDDYSDDVDAIKAIIAREGTEAGAFVFDDMRFRFSKAECIGSEVWASLRRVEMGLPILDELGMAEEAVSMLRQWTQRRGLLLVGGATGAGKTTTAVSLVTDILMRSREVAVLVEDPPEYLMQGPVGKGMCFQFEVREEADWGRKTRIALRWRPRVIMIGEIRTPEAASQALRISTSGHLVLATVHGDSPGGALGSVLRLAEVGLGAAARTMLADHVVGCVHQRLTSQGPEVKALSVPTGSDSIDNVRKLLAEARFDSLRDHVRPFRPGGQAG